MNYNDRTFIKTILCIFAFIYFGLVDAAKRGFKWLAELLFAVALLFSLPARADAPLIWGSSGPQLMQSGALTAKDGSVYPKDYEKNYLAAGASSVGAAASPVWQASGAGITCTTTVTNLPDASVGTALAVTGVSGSSAFCYADFDIDQADYSKVLKLVWDQLPVTGYVASDFRVDVYSCTVAFGAGGACSGTLTRLPLSTDSSSVTALPAITGTVTPPPTYSAPNGTAPHVQVQIGLNGASTHQMNFAQVLTGPGTVVQSAAVTQWQSYTPTGSWTTNVTYSGYWRQLGDSIEVIDNISTSGAPTSADLTIGLPSGYTINTASLPAVTGEGPPSLGSAVLLGASSQRWVGAVLYNSTATVAVAHTTPSGNFGVVNATNPFTFGSGDAVSVHFTVPIAQLAGQGTVFLGQGTPAYYYCTGGTWGTSSTCTTQQGQGGVLGGNTIPSTSFFSYTFTPTAPPPAGAVAVFEASIDGTHWSVLPSDESFGYPFDSLRYDDTNYIGAAASITSSGQIKVYFGKYVTGTSAGVRSWNGFGTWYWRVFVGYPNQATGFAAASATAPGLVKAQKQYVVGTAYTSGTPAITLAGGGGTLSSVVRGTLVPYQTVDGAWRLRFNFNAVLSSTTRTSAIFTISGVTFKNIASYYQSISGSTTNVGVTLVAASANPNTGNVEVDHNSVTTNQYMISGDVELDSKPTWAD